MNWEDNDLWAIAVGVTGSFLKGIKKQLNMRALIIQVIVGGVLAYGTIGVIDTFFAGMNSKITIVISFSVGWVANELTEYLDSTIKGLADKYLGKWLD
jgi:uncharacterized membrane protein YbjE (DUF340 family)